MAVEIYTLKISKKHVQILSDIARYWLKAPIYGSVTPYTIYISKIKLHEA